MSLVFMLLLYSIIYYILLILLLVILFTQALQWTTLPFVAGCRNDLMFTIITKLVTLSGLKVNGSCLLVSLYLQLRPGLVKSKNTLAVFSLFTLQWSLFPVTRCKGCCYDKARLCCCQRTKCFSQKLSLCFFYNHKHSGFYITVFNKLTTN